MKKTDIRGPVIGLLKIILTAVIVIVSIYGGFLGILILISEGIRPVIAWLAALILPAVLPVIWLKKRKKYILAWLGFTIIVAAAGGINYSIKKYDESITIDVTPNINVYEYLPFDVESKIVKKDSKTLTLTDELPVIDGAAAVFPVYSAFVNAVYPSDTRLYEGVFEYNNTPEGYRLLAEKETDIFFGAYPSEEQIEYAKECGTTFEFTPIGMDAFVFFVHKDNPIDNLTIEQLQGIYAGEITNWSEVGGKNEKIAAFQRNRGSGSQSRLISFMGDKPLMEPPTEMTTGTMSGIIEQVANYRSKTNSIGFSFRYYVEGIIKNPEIKLLSVNQAAPTVENIKNGSYPLSGPLYAVTYAENDNENVDKLIEWVLSDEGQEIIEETGYVGIK